MKSKLVYLIIIVITFSVVSFLAFAVAPKEIKGNGYLMDTTCLKLAGSNLTIEYIKNHTKKCALLEACVKSGENFVSEKLEVYKLDDDSNKLAHDFIKKFKKERDIHVYIEGIFDNGLLKVRTIKELE